MVDSTGTDTAITDTLRFLVIKRATSILLLIRFQLKQGLTAPLLE